MSLKSLFFFQHSELIFTARYMYNVTMVTCLYIKALAYQKGKQYLATWRNEVHFTNHKSCTKHYSTVGMNIFLNKLTSHGFSEQ